MINRIQNLFFACLLRHPLLKDLEGFFIEESPVRKKIAPFITGIDCSGLFIPLFSNPIYGSVIIFKYLNNISGLNSFPF